METNAQFTALKRKFQENYIKTITPLMYKINEDRLKEVGLVLKVIAPVALVIALVVSIVAIKELNLKAIPFVVVAAVIYGLGEYYKQVFEKRITTEVYPLVFNCFDQTDYRENPYVNNADILSSAVIKKPLKCTFENVVLSKCGETKFDTIETKLEYKSPTGKPKDAIIKQNLIIKFKIEKELNTEVVIIPGDLMHNSPRAGVKYIKLLEVKNLRKYDVFTDNERQANVIITEDLVNRMFKIQELFNGSNLRCSIHKNTFFLSMDIQKTKKVKLTSIIKPIQEMVSFAYIFTNIMSIYHLVSYFKEEK